MPTWRRRSVLAACAALSTTGALASLASTTAAETSSGPTAVGNPDGWSAPLGNAANSSYLPLDEEFEKPETVAWRYDETGTVVAVDGSVYVQTDAEIHALDADTGDLEWTVDADVSGRISVADGRVCVTDDARVVAYDADDGSVAWETALDTEEPIPDPTIALETVYVVAGETLYALDIEGGSTRWTVETVDVDPDRERFEGPKAVSFQPVSVAVAHGTVYASLEGTTFEYEEYDEEETFQRAFGAVDAETGDEQWGLAFGSADSEGHITSPIVATGHSLYAPDVGGGIGWYKIDSEGADAARHDRVYEATTEDVRIDTGYDMSREITAHNLDTDEHWSEMSGISAWRSLIVVGETIVAGHLPDTSVGEEWEYPHHSIVGLDLHDGSEKWVLEFDADLPGIAAADERTLYLTEDDELVAMRSDDETDGEDEEEEPTDGEDEEPTDDESDDGDVDDTDDEDESEAGDEPDGGSEGEGESEEGDDSDEDGTDEDDGDESEDGDETDEEGGTDETDESDGSSEGETDDGADESDDSGDESDGASGDEEQSDDAGAEDDPSENETDDDSDGIDDGSDDTGSDDLGDDETDDANESDGGATDDGDDSVPGFTTGASLVGGAATLEWLRRRAGTADSVEQADSVETDEPAE